MAESTGRALGAKASRTLNEGKQAVAGQGFDVLSRELMFLLRRAGSGVAYLGGAALFATMAAHGASTLLLRLYERFLPPRAAALALTATHVGGTAALTVIALRELKAVQDISRETIEGIAGDDE